MSPARPTVAPALEEPISVPARRVSTAPTLILLTPLAPVSQKKKQNKRQEQLKLLLKCVGSFFFFIVVAFCHLDMEFQTPVVIE